MKSPRKRSAVELPRVRLNYSFTGELPKAKKNRVFLTLLGGGVFENQPEWILSAIEHAANLIREDGHELEIFIVDYAESMMQKLNNIFQRAPWKQSTNHEKNNPILSFEETSSLVFVERDHQATSSSSSSVYIFAPCMGVTGDVIIIRHRKKGKKS